jgi:hypothetical protein
VEQVGVTAERAEWIVGWSNARESRANKVVSVVPGKSVSVERVVRPE